MREALWQTSPLIPPEVKARLRAFTPLCAQLLYNRGISSPDETSAFLSLDNNLKGDPLLLPNMSQAVKRILCAIAEGEEIAVYGDFDVDGITATALLVQGLLVLGGRVMPYIPHRYDEGYGLNNGALEALHSQGITLVITVDCGVSSVEEIEFARNLGLDVIVTDHHSVPPVLPPALAVINPHQQGCEYPFQELSGAGVAFKLLEALGQAMSTDFPDEGEFLDLVAMGTVADLVPLQGENRYFVKKGLQILNRTRRPGLKALALRAGLTFGEIDESDIGFVLSPRINAMGRLGHAMDSYRLLVCQDEEEAKQLSELLEHSNLERQELTQRVWEKARARVIQWGKDASILVVEDEDFSAGVIGLAAGRLAEEWYRPAVVIELGPETSRGSARSIPEFDIIKAIRECAHLLERYGGHPMAAGFTMLTAGISDLKRQLEEISVRELGGKSLGPALKIDAEVGLTDLPGETMRFIGQLAPFGLGNPEPLFLTRGLTVVEQRIMGKNRDHLRLRFRSKGAVWEAVGFRLGHRAEEAVRLRRIDLVYSVGIDRRGGNGTLMLNIKDFVPSHAR